MHRDSFLARALREHHKHGFWVNLTADKLRRVRRHLLRAKRFNDASALAAGLLVASGGWTLALRDMSQNASLDNAYDLLGGIAACALALMAGLCAGYFLRAWRGSASVEQLLYLTTAVPQALAAQGSRQEPCGATVERYRLRLQHLKRPVLRGDLERLEELMALERLADEARNADALFRAVSGMSELEDELRVAHFAVA